MPNTMFWKVKRHLENNQRSANSIQEQDKLLNDLPSTLRSQIISCTHGEIIERIDFFKNKETEFLFSVMPDMKPLNLKRGDVLYQQHDHAEELYFIKQGKIKLHIDINDYIVSNNSSIFITTQQEENRTQRPQINIPFISYTEGSYFGDTDLFGRSNKQLERDSTAIAVEECQFMVLTREVIMSLKRTFETEVVEI